MRTAWTAELESHSRSCRTCRLSAIDSAIPGSRVLAQIAAEALQDRTASRREAVADLEALGETELFQLSDATLERRHVGVYLQREHAGDDTGLIGDQLQVACRPGRRARGVDPGEPRHDRLELGALRQAFSEGDAGIVAGETELDAQEPAFAGDRRPQLVGDMPVRRTSSGVTSPSSTTVTRSRQSTPTGERSEEPSAGGARRHRLKASVTRPSAIPCRMSRRKSIPRLSLVGSSTP